MTLIFNIFVINTLFNQINCRVFDDSFNILVRIQYNFFSYYNIMWIIVTNNISSIWKKSYKSWLITIGFSLIKFVLNAIIKLIPLYNNSKIFR